MFKLSQFFKKKPWSCTIHVAGSTPRNFRTGDTMFIDIGLKKRHIRLTAPEGGKIKINLARKV